MPAPALLPVKLQPGNVRPLAYRVLSKKHGLNIQSDALLVLTETFSTRFGAEWRGPQGQQFLEEFAKTWKKQDRGLFIDGPGCTQVTRELTANASGSISGSTNARAARSDTLVDESNPFESEEITEISGGPRDAMDWRDFVRFVTPDEQPNYDFDRIRRQFSPRAPPGKKLQNALAPALAYFRQRHALVRERMARDTEFQSGSFASLASLGSTLAGAGRKAEITLVKNVLGRDGARFRLFGLLATNGAGKFILEDPSDHIELSFARTERPADWFFCTGMLVVVEGVYSATGGSHRGADVISGLLRVACISQPIAEPREASLDAYGHLDFMGVHTDTQDSRSALVKLDRPLRNRLHALERTLRGHRLVFLGCDVFLDDAKVRTALDRLFARLESQIQDAQDARELQNEENNINSSIAITLVMAGSFSSQALAAGSGSGSGSGSEEYKANFDHLAETLAKYPLVVSTCKLVLLPGANDPWQSTHSLGKPGSAVLPQTPIPRVFVTRLERLFPKGSLILGWNPMRINYISQEIVLLRDDLMTKFKRNDIVFETDLEKERAQLKREETGEDTRVENLVGDSGEVHLSAKVRQARRLVKTVLDQGHLQPFLKDLRIVNPAYQHAMRVEPIPLVLALFDARFESFEITYNGCKMVNLGAFISNKNTRKASYAEYYPSTKKFAHKEVYF